MASLLFRVAAGALEGRGAMKGSPPVTMGANAGAWTGPPPSKELKSVAPSDMFISSRRIRTWHLPHDTGNTDRPT